MPIMNAENWRPLPKTNIFLPVLVRSPEIHDASESVKKSCYTDLSNAIG